MTAKPDRVFDRDLEWSALTRFASNSHHSALLGIVSGRRRQGKSFLLDCYSGAGFADDLRSAKDPRLALITLDDIYRAG